MPTIRPVLAYSTITLFILFFLLLGGRKEATTAWVNLTSDPAQPDFSVYRDLDILSSHEFPIDDEGRRSIIVGDIHGMFPEFQALLSKLSYDPTHDVLVSAGDIIAKGPLEGSLSVLSYMSSKNVTGVRGNHDQKVVEWRSWINWINSIPAGRRWLHNLYTKFLKEQSHLPSGKVLKADEWVAIEMKKDTKRNNRTNLRWWKRIPEGWKLFGDHYLIALRMSERDFEYLVSRPLRIHVPHAHAYIVHAGVLASNPKKEPDARGQPLAMMPVLPKTMQDDLQKGKNGEKEVQNALRELQERAVLEKVPQNKDPWVTLNMRGIERQDVIRTKDGTPWSNVYKKDMSLCGGYDKKHKKNSLPCYPATVVYGHAASRGLDVKRWTIGLDSGCVYHRRLSSLILGGKYAQNLGDDTLIEDEDSVEDILEDMDDEDGPYDVNGKRVKSVVRFGDHGRGLLVTVSCREQ